MYRYRLWRWLSTPFRLMANFTERKLGVGDVVAGFIGVVASLSLMTIFAGMLFFVPSEASIAMKAGALLLLGVMCLTVLAVSVREIVVYYPQNQGVRAEAYASRLKERNCRAKRRRQHKVRRQYYKENPYDSLFRPWYDPAEHVE